MKPDSILDGIIITIIGMAYWILFKEPFNLVYFGVGMMIFGSLKLIFRRK